MGGPLSVTLSDIHIIPMETDVLVPIRPIFHNWYIDDIYNRRQKNTSDVLYDALNNYHPKIKLTIEPNPQRLLDTEITHINGSIERWIHRKKRKLTIPWTANIPTLRQLYCPKQISSHFKVESAGYPKGFVNTVIWKLNAFKENRKSDFTVAFWRKEERYLCTKFSKFIKVSVHVANVI